MVHDTDSRQGDAGEPRYLVFAPGGRVAPTASTTEPLGTLDGKVIVELWDYMFDGDVMLGYIREELVRRFPGVTLLPYTEVGNIHGTDELEVVAGLPELLRARGVDGAITLVAC